MISIIAPVYNVEKYLDQFIKSVLSQSYSEFELLLVEDCATDNSLEICLSYANNDKRVKILKQSQNMGVAKARNRGLAEAKGEFIMLADSDDYLSRDALEVSYRLILEADVDIAYLGFYHDCDGRIAKKNLER